jgi:sialate O-acetylesterase
MDTSPPLPTRPNASPARRSRRGAGLARFAALSVVLLLGGAAARAEVVLPSVISDGMVLQRGVSVPVWGWADRGENINVEFAGQSKTAVAGSNGRWRIELDPLEASTEPRTMTVTGKNKVEVGDILVGEVWLAAGQSNMEWTFHQIAPEEQALAAAQKDNKLIRAFHVSRHLVAAEPMDDTTGRWKNAAQMIVQPGVSAVGFFFAVDLAAKLGVPVGLLDVNWGGKKIEAFLPPEGYKAIGVIPPPRGPRPMRLPHKLAELRELRDSVDESIRGAEKGLAIGTVDGGRIFGQSENFIWNAMLSPVAPYALRGAIWYQGESNRGAQDYLAKLRGLSAGWSQAFNLPDIPILMVQIAPFDYSRGADPSSTLLGDTIWAAQYRAADEVKGIDLVAIHDTGVDIKDIHPMHKRAVGERLSALAQKNQYGRDIAASGPRFAAAKNEGDRVVVTFTGVDRGLETTDGQAPSWFELSADGTDFFPAQASLAGNTVVLTAPGLPGVPASVRMGWRDIALPNLRDKNGWPVFAFPAQPVAPAAPAAPTAPTAP